MKICFFIFFFVLSCTAHAQVLQPAAALDKFRNEYPQEKVFLQTDKTQYFAGESIWMKAWCMLDGAPTYLSRLLYIDLVNSKGEVVLKKMFKLDSLSTTAADFDLPAKIKPGNYSINAYTLWMLNFPGFVYSKNIFIYSAEYLKETKPEPKPELKMYFFPEGGDLIAGLKNRVAFKAVNENGFPVAVAGNITDSKGKVCGTIATIHDGMGTVDLQIESGETYTADIPSASGRTLQFKLPIVKDEGITLRVENTNANRMFVVLYRAEQNKERYNKLKVIAQLNAQVIMQADMNFEDGITAAPINKKNLPAGIVLITVFDSANNPLAERLAFVENYSLEQPIIKLDTLNLKARGKNQISFGLDSMVAAISVKVTNAALDEPNTIEDNIVSAFLATTDLKGFIHQPGYYFKNKEAATLKHLDLLLMTHGWRRFEWKKVLQNDFVQLKYPVESAITFRGKVTKSDRTAAVKDGHVSFVIRGEDSTRIMADANITDKGEFLVSDINFRKRAAVAYQGTNNKKENLIVDVKLEPAYIDSLKRSTDKPLVNLDTIDINNRRNAWANYVYGLVKLADTVQSNYLGDVVVKARKMSKEDSLNNAYASGPFIMGQTIDPTVYQNYTTVWQMLQAAVAGITVEGNFFDPNVFFNRFNGLNMLSDNNGSSVNVGSSSGGDVSVDVVTQTNGIAYFLNEVNVDKDVINSLSPSDIAVIKVLKNEGTVLGAAAGVIAFYTKKGEAVRWNPTEKVYTKTEREGYAVIKTFFAPDYETYPDLNKNETDKRYTLYWNGNIKPAKDGKYRFRFFNNDISNKYKIIVQGIDAAGNFIYAEQLVK